MHLWQSDGLTADRRVTPKARFEPGVDLGLHTCDHTPPAEELVDVELDFEDRHGGLEPIEVSRRRCSLTSRISIVAFSLLRCLEARYTVSGTSKVQVEVHFIIQRFGQRSVLKGQPSKGWGNQWLLTDENRHG